MAIVARYNPASLSKDTYDKASALIQERTQWPPDGLKLHVCFGTDGDLKVSEIWESAEQMQAFGEELMPLLSEAGVQIAGDPEVFEVHGLEFGDTSD